MRVKNAFWCCLGMWAVVYNILIIPVHVAVSFPPCRSAIDAFITENNVVAFIKVRRATSLGTS